MKQLDKVVSLVHATKASILRQALAIAIDRILREQEEFENAPSTSIGEIEIK